jgi:hypothetical protein
MMQSDKPQQTTTGYLFQVEVWVEGASNALAMSSLLQALNHPKVKDFRITGGIERGNTIDRHESTAAKTADAGKKAPALPTMSEKELKYFERLINEGKLVRLIVVKGKGVKLSIPCRILHFDSDLGTLAIYHVDEKKVYSFKLNEIDDIIE